LSFMAFLCGCGGGGELSGDSELEQLAKELGHALHFRRRSAVRALYRLLTADDLLAALAVRAGCTKPLQALAVDKRSPQLQAEALRTLALLSLCYAGCRSVVEGGFVERLLVLALPPKPGRDARLGFECTLLMCALADDGETCALLYAAGCAGCAVLSCAAPSLRTSHLGFHLLMRFAELPDAVAGIVARHGAAELAGLVLHAQARAFESEHLDTQRAALKCATFLAESPDFANAFEAAGGLAVLLRELRAEVPALRVHAGHALATLCRHPRLRLLLVRKRVLQSFVSLADTESRREDLIDSKRVAALGIAACAATYQLRLAAAVAGALPAVQKLLSDEDAEVRCLAANALMMLSLHEESSRRLVFAGALRPLMAMARSGEPLQERCAVGALATLAINEENQKPMLTEGVMGVINYLSASSDASVRHHAAKLLKRIRLGQFRGAARMARIVVAKALELQALQSGEARPALAPQPSALGRQLSSAQGVVASLQRRASAVASEAATAAELMVQRPKGLRRVDSGGTT